MAPRYDDCVFLNVPFDKRYEPLLRALVYSVHDCGFIARCARELEDGGQVRLDKIYELIRDSKYGIHDLSRTGLDRIHRLPRFNMPLELGIFLGARKFGAQEQQTKACLILDHSHYRYVTFCSDLAGHDLRAHSNRVEELIAGVRDWLSNQLVPRGVQVPSASRLMNRYLQFQASLPVLCSELSLVSRELTFNEHRRFVTAWLHGNPW